MDMPRSVGRCRRDDLFCREGKRLRGDLAILKDTLEIIDVLELHIQLSAAC
jgi:hypothetical protein